MILYIIAQGPLYQAIKKTYQIRSIETPSEKRKIIGYADDSTFIVKSDLDIIYIFTILKHFELASTIKLNTKKTKIFGFGNWQGRLEWPYPDLKVETTNISILGITYAPNIDQAADMCWSVILTNIRKKAAFLSQRNFTIFQRAVLINIVLLSKVWYTAHTYPLTIKYAKLITKEIFHFLWQSNYNPIKREALYQSKDEGGLGIFNVFYKSQGIFISTFLKQFLNSEENSSLIKFYCALRLNPIFNILELPINTSVVKSKFYDNIVTLVRKFIHVKNFPHISSLNMYIFLLPYCKPTSESLLNVNWKTTWKNLNYKYVNIHVRDIVFKFLHNILTTKNRLFQIKRNDSPLCSLCNVVEDKVHMFIECRKVKDVLQYFKELLFKVCNVKSKGIVNTLHLDFKAKRKDNNTAVILTSTYIGCIWFNRARVNCIEYHVYKTNLLKHHNILSLILKDKMSKNFNEKFANIDKTL